MRAKLCKIAYKLGLRSLAYRIDYETAERLYEAKREELKRIIAQIVEAECKLACSIIESAKALERALENIDSPQDEVKTEEAQE